MKQRLCIGIQDLSPAWEKVLHQTGVWFERADYSLDLRQNYSAIILNRYPDKNHLNALNDYLRNAGAILEMSNAPVFTEKDRLQSQTVKTLINISEQKAYQHIPFIDFYTKITKHKDSQIFGGLVHFQPLNNGTVGFLGADVPSLIMDRNFRRKRFYSFNTHYPDEIVSKISKHELIETFTATLKELHFRQNLPFVQKWTSPEHTPVFCFRIDSDFGDRESIDNLYKTIEKKGISATWFLHTEAHETWLEHFQSFANQEIALHCYEHGTSADFQKTFSNIQKGRKLLKQAGFQQIDGFAAPYGIWNKALEEVLPDFDFNYTSEFTFGYDGVPIQPDKNKLPLQIPIHPVCTGSLSRQRYSYDDMENYFSQIIQNKLARFEPVLFYHHPMQPGLKIFERVFEKVNNLGLTNLTFAVLTEFWKSRQSFSFEAWYNRGKVQVQKFTNPEKLLQVSINHNQFHLMKTSDLETDFLKNPEYEYSKPYLPEPEQIKKMRALDFRLMKTSLLDWKNRIRL